MTSLLLEAVWENDFRRVLRQARAKYEQGAVGSDSNLEREFKSTWEEVKDDIPFPDFKDLRRALQIIAEEFDLDVRILSNALKLAGSISENTVPELETLPEESLNESLEKYRVAIGSLVLGFKFLAKSVIIAGLSGGPAASTGSTIIFSLLGWAGIILIFVGVVSGGIQGVFSGIKSLFQKAQTLFSRRKNNENKISAKVGDKKPFEITSPVPYSDSLRGALNNQIRGSLPVGTPILIHATYKNNRRITDRIGFNVVHVLAFEKDGINAIGKSGASSFGDASNELVSGSWYSLYISTTEIIKAFGLNEAFLNESAYSVVAPYLPRKDLSPPLLRKAYNKAIERLSTWYYNQASLAADAFDIEDPSQPSEYPEFNATIRRLQKEVNDAYQEVRDYFGLKPKPRGYFVGNPSVEYESRYYDVEMQLNEGILGTLGKIVSDTVRKAWEPAKIKFATVMRKLAKSLDSNDDQRRRKADKLYKQLQAKKEKLEATLKQKFERLEQQTNQRLEKLGTSIEDIEARKREKEKIQKQKEATAKDLGDSFHDAIQNLADMADKIQGTEEERGQTQFKHVRRRMNAARQESFDTSCLDRWLDESIMQLDVASSGSYLIEEIGKEVITSVQDKEDFLDIVIRYVTSQVGKTYEVKKDLKAYVNRKPVVIERGESVKVISLLRAGSSSPVDPQDRQTYQFFKKTDPSKSVSPLYAQYEVLPLSGPYAHETVKAYGVFVMDALFPHEWDDLKREYDQMRKQKVPTPESVEHNYPPWDKIPDYIKQALKEYKDVPKTVPRNFRTVGIKASNACAKCRFFWMNTCLRWNYPVEAEDTCESFEPIPVEETSRADLPMITPGEGLVKSPCPNPFECPYGEKEEDSDSEFDENYEGVEENWSLEEKKGEALRKYQLAFKKEHEALKQEFKRRKKEARKNKNRKSTKEATKWFYTEKIKLFKKYKRSLIVTHILTGNKINLEDKWKDLYINETFDSDYDSEFDEGYDARDPAYNKIHDSNPLDKKRKKKKKQESYIAEDVTGELIKVFRGIVNNQEEFDKILKKIPGFMLLEFNKDIIQIFSQFRIEIISFLKSNNLEWIKFNSIITNFSDINLADLMAIVPREDKKNFERFVTILTASLNKLLRLMQRKLAEWEHKLSLVQTTASHKSLLKNVSRKTGMSISAVEGYWKMAMEEIERKGISKSSDRFYPKVMNTFKELVGLKESFLYECLMEEDIDNQEMPLSAEYLEQKKELEDWYTQSISATQAEYHDYPEEIENKLQQIEIVYQQKLAALNKAHQIDESYTDEEQQLVAEYDAKMQKVEDEVKQKALEAGEESQELARESAAQEAMLEKNRLRNEMQKKLDQLRSKYDLPPQALVHPPQEVVDESYLSEGYQQILSAVQSLVRQHFVKRSGDLTRLILQDPRKIERLRAEAEHAVRSRRNENVNEGLFSWPVDIVRYLVTNLWNGYITLLEAILGNTVRNLWDKFLDKNEVEIYNIKFTRENFASIVFAAFTFSLVTWLASSAIPTFVPSELLSFLYERAASSWDLVSQTFLKVAF